MVNVVVALPAERVGIGRRVLPTNAVAAAIRIREHSSSLAYNPDIVLRFPLRLRAFAVRIIQAHFPRREASRKSPRVTAFESSVLDSNPSTSSARR